MSEEKKFLSYQGVIQMTSLRETTIRRLIEAGDFPAPISLSPRRRAFLQSEIEAWMEDRIADARLQQQPV